MFLMIEIDDNICSACSQAINRKKLVSSGSYFVNIPIENQLKCISNSNCCNCIHNWNTKTNDNVKDTRNRIQYKNLLYKINIDTNVVTLIVMGTSISVAKFFYMALTVHRK